MVVVDSEGRAVKGLERDDFELEVDGEILEISIFFAIENALPQLRDSAAGEEAEPLPRWVSADELIPLHVVFFFDQSNLESNHRERLLVQ